MATQETSMGKLERARLIGRLLSLRDVQATLNGPERAKVVQDLLDVREKLGFANAATHDSEADDLTQEEGAGATDAPAPKQGRATNAEELAELLKQSLALGIDIKDAYVRPDIDTPIDILYGNQKMGLRHLKAQRAKDGSLSVVTMDEILDAVAQSIARGKKELARDGERIILRLGDATAVLVKNPQKNAWLLTGWSLSWETLEKLKELPPGERRSAFFNSAPTLASSTRSRTSEGAGGAQGHSTTSPGKTEDAPLARETDDSWEADRALFEKISKDPTPDTLTDEHQAQVQAAYDRNKDNPERLEFMTQALNAWGVYAAREGAKAATSAAEALKKI